MVLKSVLTKQSRKDPKIYKNGPKICANGSGNVAALPPKTSLADWVASWRKWPVSNTTRAGCEGKMNSPPQKTNYLWMSLGKGGDVGALGGKYFRESFRQNKKNFWKEKICTVLLFLGIKKLKFKRKL